MSCLKLSKKRKIEDEGRVFNKQWTERYFFTDVGVKAVCLIWHETVALLKEFNLKRHFFGHNLSKQELQKKATDLVKGLKQQQTVFEKTSSLQRNATKASFVLANKITSHLQKPNLLKIACLMCQCCVLKLGGTTPETNEIGTHICSCHNFPPLSSVQILLIPACCLLCVHVKSLYRHFFLEDISKHARVTQKMALPNLWQSLHPGALTDAPQTRCVGC